MATSSSGPGAVRVRPGTVTLNGDRTDAERITLVLVNTGDRPIQVGSHLHLPDANNALDFDREAAAGFRLDVPSGTSQRFEPGASRSVSIVALRGRRVVPGIQVRADGAYVISGAAPADELRERLSVEELPNENQYDTVAGFVMLQLQKIPIVGDRFEWLGYLFEVTEMDGKRVDEVVVSQRVKIDEDEPAAQG